MNIEAIIVEKHWRLLNAKGHVRSSYVRFGDAGAILGYQHINEATWGIEEGRLVFRHAAGHVTARSDNITTDADGNLTIAMVMAKDDASPAHILVERHLLLNFLDYRSTDEVIDGVQRHPAFAGGCRMGSAGFSIPAIEKVQVIPVSIETAPRLAEYGLKVTGPFGAGNAIIISENMRKTDLNIFYGGSSANTVFLDQQTMLRGTLRFEGDENIVVACGSDKGTSNVIASFRHNATGLFIGAGGSAANFGVWLEGPGRSIQIGDEYLFSWGIWLRTADGHGLLDLDTGKIVNPSRSIVIGPHVWLGQDVLVMPGASIGGGSVAGARAIVSKPLPANCVAVGAPARIVRRRTSWTRLSRPSAQQISDVVSQEFEEY
jgi:acetyltransferase-like isoleucine patch superfamily enzyme